MQPIEQRIGEIASVLMALTKYYKAHPVPENEILVRIALSLDAHRLALTYLFTRKSFGETEVQEVATLLEPSDPEMAANIKRVIPMIRSMLPGDREKLRKESLSNLMKNANALVDTSQRLLKARELKDQGLSEQEIKKYLSSWKIDNVF